MRLADPLLPRILAHLRLQMHVLIGQNVGFRDPAKVFSSVNLLHFGHLSVHQIFAGDVERKGKVVDFLVPGQSLVHGFLDGTDLPKNCPVLRLGVIDVFKAIILQRVPDDLYVVVA